MKDGKEKSKETTKVIKTSKGRPFNPQTDLGKPVYVLRAQGVEI